MCALTPQPLVLLLLPKVQEQLSLLSISSSKNKVKTAERAAAGSQSFTRKAEQSLHGQQLMFSLGALGRTMLAVSANSKPRFRHWGCGCWRERVCVLLWFLPVVLLELLRAPTSHTEEGSSQLKPVCRASPQRHLTATDSKAVSWHLSHSSALFLLLFMQAVLVFVIFFFYNVEYFSCAP